MKILKYVFMGFLIICTIFSMAILAEYITETEALFYLLLLITSSTLLFVRKRTKIKKGELSYHIISAINTFFYTSNVIYTLYLFDNVKKASYIDAMHISIILTLVYVLFDFLASAIKES